MKCSECGLCVSLDGVDGYGWQCRLTGDSWAASSPAGINRACFAPVTAKAAFVKRLLGKGAPVAPGSAATGSASFLKERG